MHILKVGTTAGGTLKIGESIHLGWTSKDGNAPDQGSVLIVAHSNHTGYAPLNRLFELRKGQIETLTSAGKTFRYKVVRKPFFVKHLTSSLTSKMTQAGGRPTLWLATCALNYYDWTHHRYTGWEISKAVLVKHHHN